MVGTVEQKDRIMHLLLDALASNKIVSIIDRNVSSFAYLLGLEAVAREMENGNYVWIISYDPLRSLFRDMNRVGVNYREHLGENLFIFDVFGSMRGIEFEMDGVFTLRGYLDDNVFIVKYQRLISELIKTLRPTPMEVKVLGHLESGLCRLFKKPLKVQRKIWNLFMETPLKVSAINTYLLPECQGMDELPYFSSDIVIEGIVDNGKRRLIVAKGGSG